jgi:citrate synthase
MIEIEGVQYLTVDEACAVLGVKPATIYAYVSRGTLRSYKQGIKRQRLYRADEVTALTEIQPGDAPSQRLAPARATEEAPRAEKPAPTQGYAPDEQIPAAEGWMSEV